MKRRVASVCHLGSIVRVMDRYPLLFLLCLFTAHQADSYRFTQGLCKDNFVMCETGQVRPGTRAYITNDRGCIPRNYVCDRGTPDCIDGSDEKYCPYDFNTEPEQTPAPPTEDLSVPTPTKRSNIDSHQPSTTTVRPEVDFHQWTGLLAGRQEVPMFALRVGVKMRQLDSQTYLQAERLINQVLFEAQMGNITYFTHLLHCTKYLHSSNRYREHEHTRHQHTSPTPLYLPFV